MKERQKNENKCKIYINDRHARKKDSLVSMTFTKVIVYATCVYNKGQQTPKEWAIRRMRKETLLTITQSDNAGRKLKVRKAN